MRISAPLLEARLLRRYKRFLADVELPSGERLTAHCPNPGRLLGCLPERARVVLRDSENPARKLRHTLQTIRVGRTWVNVDTLLPNALVAEALESGDLPELAGYAARRPEVRYGARSRVDFLLEDPARPPCYVEVKCTTLVEDGVAMFPDAVTARGLSHLRELAQVVETGARAVLLFVVSRSDATRFEPADHIDPAFGAALRTVVDAGVEPLAYTTTVRPDRFELRERIPVALPARASR